MVDSGGHIYHVHPDKVAKRLKQGWVLVDPPAEPEKIEVPVVKRARKRKKAE